MSRSFLASEKIHQSKVKLSEKYFSPSAQTAGKYKQHSYPFCLPVEYAEENLLQGIRQQILDYFQRYEIKWHDGQNGKPSNHLCDSQVSCANFLFPFYNQPYALAALLNPIFPTLECMLPIENDQFVAFEWIGQKNYLGEKISQNGKRTRGANFTSADAAVMFQHLDGSKQIVLIEWKYTEAYGGTFLKTAKSGTDRTKIYAHLYDRDDCILDKSLIPSFDDIFYEPFYQFMRQQFLAHEMEKAGEFGADRVSLLHISPDHNDDFKAITSPALRKLGQSPTEVWGRLVTVLGRFLGVKTESLFGRFDIEKFPAMKEWYEYLLARYPWVKEQIV